MTIQGVKTKRNYRKKKIGTHTLHPETQMMGYGYDPMLSEGALKPPLFQTSTFVFENAAAGKAFFELAYGKRAKSDGEEPGLIYSRINNPNLEVLEDRLALWDGAEKALSFSSGMAAIATTLFAYLRPGDVILYSAPLYGGTEYMIRNILPQFGVKSVAFTSWNAEQSLEKSLEKAQNMGRLSVIYVETPGNPTNCLIDIEDCAKAARDIEAKTGEKPCLIVDNTFLGPLWQRPLDHGADIVLYSLTKYVGGHSDLVAGAVLGNAEKMGAVGVFRTIMGTMCDPHTSWLLMRSLETLKLRMTASAEGAKSVAAFLQNHAHVKNVGYLGFLPQEDACYGTYQRQCKSAGSTFAFDIASGREADAFAVLDRLQIIKLAVSLGGTESLMEHPYSMTHADVPDDIKDQLGITPAMLRISVGVENPEDLIADLEQALAILG